MNRIAYLFHEFHEDDIVKAQKRMHRAKKLRKKQRRSKKKRAQKAVAESGR